MNADATHSDLIGVEGVYHPLNKTYVIPARILAVHNNRRVDIETVDSDPTMVWKAEGILLVTDLQPNDPTRWFCPNATLDDWAELTSSDVETDDPTDLGDDEDDEDDD